MLKLKIPPVVVTIIFGGLIWLMDYLLPNESLLFPFLKWLSGFLFLMGGTIAILGVLEFRRKSTTINPHKPHNTTHLVDSGMYRISRNPMYLGLFIILCSCVFFAENLYNLVVLPLFIWYMNEFQIKPEEEVMQKKFGGIFQGYKYRVKRWL